MYWRSGSDGLEGEPAAETYRRVTQEGGLDDRSERGEKNSVALSISLLRVQIQSYFFKVLIAHLENIAGGST